MTRYNFDWPGYSPLLDRCEATPDRTALIDTRTDHCWTYRELSEEVSCVANSLQEFGQEHGVALEDCPRVGYLLQPSHQFVTTLYALWHLGWTAVGIHRDLTAEELETHAEIAKLDGVVVESEDKALAETVDCPTVTADTLVQSRPDEPVERPEPVEWGRDETALILFTSGTTGRPKGVRLTFGNLIGSATATAFRLGVDPSDRWLCCLPISHMGGLAPVVRTVLYGTTLVVQRTFDTAATAEILDDYRITEVSLVPTQLKRLLDDGWTPDDSLDTVLLGGAPATEDLLDRAEAIGAPVYPTYGMTEAASGITIARPDERRENSGTVGQPLLGTDVTVLANGEPVGLGEEGELVVDGPTVTPGYLETGFTESAFGDYGFHTGDVGYRDEAGRLWVVGRVDDLINTGGELVSPATVGEAIIEDDAIRDAAVVGLPDEEWGERVAALVVPVERANPTAEKLRERCRDRLAAYKVPKTIEFANEIPRTASGTVDREAVRKQL
jgi:O-succinylbenzoic acid--CoA ligase